MQSSASLSSLEDRFSRRRENSKDDQKVLDQCERTMIKLSNHLLKLEIALEVE